MLTHLTAPRLATIQAFFKAKFNEDIIGCYAWNQAVASGLLPILSDFEVSLRNALHRALSQHFGNVDSFDWMMPQPNPARAVNPAAPMFLPSRHKLNKKAKEDIETVMTKIKGKKPAGYVVTPDDIVAALSFGFWEVLISSLSHNSHPAGLQDAVLAAMLPNAPDTVTLPYGSVAFKVRVTNLLKRIRDVRNRIGHHDSLWITPEFDHHGVLGFIPRRPRHTVNSFRSFADNVCWFVGWIDPAISRYIKNSDHWWSLQALLQPQALVTYRQLGGKAGTYRTLLDSTKLPGRSKKILNKSKSRCRERLVANRYFY